MTEEKKTVAKAARANEKRRPFGVKVGRLAIFEDIPGYHLRWINDEPGRLNLADQSGYSFVSPEEVGRAPTESGRCVELVGLQRDNSTPMYAYLMKIPMEWYEEDKAAREQLQDNFDNAIRAGQLDRQNGDGRYVKNVTYKTNKN